MPRRLAQLLAVLTACSTVLAGVRPCATASTESDRSVMRISATPSDADDHPDPRSEPTTEAEQRENEEKEVESQSDLFAEVAVARRLKARPFGVVDSDARPGERHGCSPLPVIRGPPARG